MPHTADHLLIISMPPFSPRNDKIIPAIYLALVGISDQAFGSWLELRYVPTLRTCLPKNAFFFRGVGSRGPRGACRQETIRFSPRIFPANFPREFSPLIFPTTFPCDFPCEFPPRFFPAIFPRDFFPRTFPANFSREFSPEQ
jgi:hypothetical protein